jgi:arsenite-transporting ATPase
MSLRESRGGSLKDIEHVATEHAQRYAVIPLMAEEPVGVERLLALSK